MDELRFAVVGAGLMGRTLARAAHELPYAHCVAAADVDETRAQELVSQYGGQAYHDYAAMLVRAKPDVVLVATPEHLHCEPVIAAAQQGCHVFVEKPLATDLADADAMIAACARNRVKLMTGYILRFESSYALLQAAIGEGSIGTLLSAYARRDASINEARRLGGRGSAILYLAVHDIDQMLWYHPVPVKSVFARRVRGRVHQELGVDDFIWLMLEFADGALGVVECGWALPEQWNRWQRPTGWGGFGDVQMHVIGTDGVLDLNFVPMDVYGCDREGWKMPDTRHWPVVNGKLAGAVKLEVEHLFECVLRDQTPLVTGEEGRRSLEVALAAERSLVAGAPVALA